MINIKFGLYIFEIIILFIFLWKIKDYFTSSETKKKINKIEKCNVYILSNSTGLLVDQKLICDIFKNFANTPNFYVENFDNNSSSNDYIFVNLDYTNFYQLFYNENAPKNILCKNKETLRILSDIFPKNNLIYTGFTSNDIYNPQIQKDYKKFLHVVGKSPNKGTTQLVKTWNLHPEWPILTIICNNYLGVVDGIYNILNGKINSNINLITTFISENELYKIMNEYGIHICISSYEGFGHTSNESRSCKAVTMYTDMPSFQDRFIDGNNGISVKSKQNGNTNQICPIYISEIQDIEYSVDRIMKMNENELKNIGNQARYDFLKDDYEFKLRLSNLIKNFEKNNLKNK